MRCTKAAFAPPPCRCANRSNVPVRQNEQDDACMRRKVTGGATGRNGALHGVGMYVRIECIFDGQSGVVCVWAWKDDSVSGDR